MKKHLPLTTALLTVLLNLALVAWFIPRMRLIMALQADPAISLPAASRKAPPDKSGELRLTLAAGGIVLFEGTSLSEESLERLLVENREVRVAVETSIGVKYEQLRTFLGTLRTAGVKKIVLKVSD